MNYIYVFFTLSLEYIQIMSLVVICNDNIAYQSLEALIINKQVNNTTVFVEVFSNSKPPRTVDRNLHAIYVSNEYIKICKYT